MSVIIAPPGFPDKKVIPDDEIPVLFTTGKKILLQIHFNGETFQIPWGEAPSLKALAQYLEAHTGIPVNYKDFIFINMRYKSHFIWTNKKR